MTAMRLRAISAASGVRSYSDTSGPRSTNSVAASTQPMATSMAAMERASDRTRFRSPRPMALPIITADTEDMAMTITFKYW